MKQSQEQRDMVHEGLVSVVIPNRNYGGYLAQALDSVLAQTYRRLEITVVDDGSTDQSREVLRRYQTRLRVILQSCRGVSAARNRGVQESRGEYVAFLDSDDIWLPDKLQRQVESLRAEPGAGLVHCGAQLIDGTGRLLAAVTDGIEGRVLTDLLLFRRAGVVTGGSGMLLRRELFEEVGGFDTGLSTSADWDFFYRVGSRRLFRFLPEPLVQMRMHHANMRSNIRAMEHDMLRAFGKAFRDAEPEVRRIRRQAYGRLHLVLAGSFFRARRPDKFLQHALKSFWLTPASAARLAGFPLRWWRRRKDHHASRAQQWATT